MNTKIYNTYFIILEAIILLLSLICWINLIFANPSGQNNENLNFTTITNNVNDSWNENFIFKKTFSDMDSIITYLACGAINSTQVVQGNENWLFYTNTMEDYTGSHYHSEEELNSILETVSKTQSYFEQNNINFVIAIIPNKNSIYAEYMPPLYSHSDVSRTDCLVEHLQNEGINIITPKEELLAQHTAYQIYYKYDSHWNQLGAYIGVQSILDTWNIELPPLEDNSIISFPQENSHLNYVSNDLAKMAGLHTFCNNEQDFFIENTFVIDWDAFAENSRNYGSSVFINHNAMIDAKLLIIGDSFRISMLPSLCNVFSEVCVIERYYYSAEILSDFCPNYVIVEYVERNSADIKTIDSLIP